MTSESEKSPKRLPLILGGVLGIVLISTVVFLVLFVGEQDKRQDLEKENAALAAQLEEKIATEDKTWEENTDKVAETETPSGPLAEAEAEGVNLVRSDWDFKPALLHYVQNPEQAVKVYGNLAEWDVSKVTDMGFLDKTYKEVIPHFPRNFAEDLSRWNTSSVTDMNHLFDGCPKFNADLSKWDTSKVTSMESMFNGAGSFNADISGWDTSQVTNMARMFLSASFNQPIGSWDVSKVTNMHKMFKGKVDSGTMEDLDLAPCVFNQPLGDWDVSKVTSMSEMFHGCSDFNQPLGNWKVSQNQRFDQMFAHTSFDQDLSKWEFKGGVDVSLLDDDGTCQYDDTQCHRLTMDSMFQSTPYNQDISTWNLSDATSISYLFAKAERFDQDISAWGESLISNKYLGSPNLIAGPRAMLFEGSGMSQCNKQKFYAVFLAKWGKEMEDALRDSEDAQYIFTDCDENCECEIGKSHCTSERVISSEGACSSAGCCEWQNGSCTNRNDAQWEECEMLEDDNENTDEGDNDDQDDEDDKFDTDVHRAICENEDPPLTEFECNLAGCCEMEYGSCRYDSNAKKKCTDPASIVAPSMQSIGEMHCSGMGDGFTEEQCQSSGCCSWDGTNCMYDSSREGACTFPESAKAIGEKHCTESGFMKTQCLLAGCCNWKGKYDAGGDNIDSDDRGCEYSPQNPYPYYGIAPCLVPTV
mmetsp:Transcript_16229/g.19466  ORF Transcript_16229/g.19466 Transcript_16229/m.19466 type:complete len:698 (+) Transcript_16229:118-2211(+)|eukprot:CAMPEP_0197847292 /NCGR_PEP_ID=MMETSP1438-20131217/5690_1 /TAXON_ID=1461541 /ORGANISM="Pterosperma sp., Strain CCMP1384" /LENGTH=697 /DNA_ID=CAMNT_0043459167 /DNA_START=115 /DNA_END=2208 /DNA_ORIENTATION=-